MISWILYSLGLFIAVAAGFYTLVLIGRIVLDWVRYFKPLWRPEGIFLLLANLVYQLTDAPLRQLRKVIPPLRLGNGIALDIGAIVLFLALGIAQRIGIWLQFLSFS